MSVAHSRCHVLLPVQYLFVRSEYIERQQVLSNGRVIIQTCLNRPFHLSIRSAGRIKTQSRPVSRSLAPFPVPFRAGERKARCQPVTQPFGAPTQMSRGSITSHNRWASITFSDKRLLLSDRTRSHAYRAHNTHAQTVNLSGLAYRRGKTSGALRGQTNVRALIALSDARSGADLSTLQLTSQALSPYAVQHGHI